MNADHTPEEKAHRWRTHDPRVRFPAPPVCTAAWDDAAWIAYVDSAGTWGPTVQEEADDYASSHAAIDAGEE